MSPADTPRGVTEGTRRVDPPSPSFARSIARLLYTQNPFYLLSVAFVLHSTRLWYREGTGPFDPWPLMAIIGGYILLTAVTGFLLVRFGKVWDDARSILLILLLLFVELSLTFDGLLISQPVTGRILLATGLGLALVVSEGLLLGLSIRLPILFRIPYHLLLVLLFLYPLAIVTGLGSDRSAAVWRIYLYSPVSAAILLTLLPAIRRGPEYVAQTGTPWRWPWFPWSLFGFLAICVGLRAYAISLSFDPVLSQQFPQAMRLDSAFGLYFLAPIFLAIALLLLEAGIVAKNRRIQLVALLIPAACLIFSFPQQHGSLPYADFLRRLTDRVGSPFWLSAMGGILFYSLACARQVKFAEPAFWSMLLIGSCIDRRMVDLSGIVPPQAWALWLVAIVQTILGRIRFNSRNTFVAVMAVLAAIRSDFLIDTGPLVRDVLPVHLAGLTVLILGAAFNDSFARWLRQAGVLFVVAAVFAAAVVPVVWLPGVPEWTLPAYMAGVTAATFGYAYFIGSPAYFFAGLANLCLIAGRLLYELSGYLKRLLVWEGAAWFVWGLVWFSLAVLISAVKSGLVRRLARILPGHSGGTRGTPLP